MTRLDGSFSPYGDVSSEVRDYVKLAIVSFKSELQRSDMRPEIVSMILSTIKAIKAQY